MIEERGFEADVDHLVEHTVVSRVDGRPSAGSGIVDEAVESAKGLGRELNCPLGNICGSHIGSERLYVGRRGEIPRQPVETFLPSRDSHDPEAARGKPACDCIANSCARAGHQDYRFFRRRRFFDGRC
jgi:hypothetical protein